MNIEEMSFEELLEAYEPLIKKIIKQLYGERYADELYQIGMIALWEAKENFNKNKGYFAGYVKKFIWGRMLTFLRKEKTIYEKINYNFNEELLEQIASPLPDEKQKLQLHHILPLLSEKEKLWFYEAIILEKTQKKIAVDNNVSTETVKTWRSRVITKLRKHEHRFE